MASVVAPATPSRPSPLTFWKAMTACMVELLYCPSGETSYFSSASRVCSVVTAAPESPGRSPLNGTVVALVEVLGAKVVAVVVEVVVVLRTFCTRWVGAAVRFELPLLHPATANISTHTRAMGVTPENRNEAMDRALTADEPPSGARAACAAGVRAE